MSKKKKPKNSPKKNEHAYFSLEGSIFTFPGSMLELASKVTPSEWDQMIRDTVHYKLFIECVKEIACPRLEEPWTTDDNLYLVELSRSIDKMRNIDPLLVAKHNQKDIKEAFVNKMNINIEDLKNMIDGIRAQSADAAAKLKQSETINVSNL